MLYFFCCSFESLLIFNWYRRFVFVADLNIVEVRRLTNHQPPGEPSGDTRLSGSRRRKARKFSITHLLESRSSAVASTAETKPAATGKSVRIHTYGHARACTGTHEYSCNMSHVLSTVSFLFIASRCDEKCIVGV